MSPRTYNIDPNHLDFASLGSAMFFMTYAKVCGIMFQGWLVYLKKGNPVFIHFTTIIAQLFIATIYYFKNFTSIENIYNLKYTLALLLIVFWAARVGGYSLWYKTFQNYTDYRHDYFSSKSDNTAMFWLFQFLFQGAISVVITLQLYFVFNSREESLTFLNILGAFISLVGIIHEWEADKQMVMFKDSSKIKGEIYRGGWWRKSRHPNYFFEMCFWTGLAIMGISEDPFTMYAFLGPLLMFMIFNFVLIPLTERHMSQTKHDFEVYKAKTNRWFPY
jgi:steroid 5-alpha reductase family enzyme